MIEINKIYCESNIDTMARMPSNYVKLIITSPPYDGLRIYKGYSFQFEETACELARILQVGGCLVWIVGDSVVNGSESGTSFRQALYFMDICGLRLHDTMIYHKTGLTLNHNRYEQEFEYMFVFSKGRPATFNPIKIPCKYFGKDSDRTGQKYSEHSEINKKLRSGKDRGNIKETKIKGNVWNYNVGFGHCTHDKIAYKHPAIFPEKMAADHIITWSNEGDLVYDPFGGSGTTAKMAHLLSRPWIISEISKEYVQEITIPRLAPYLDQGMLF